MVCQNCGAQNNDEAGLCSQCGQALQASPTPERRVRPLLGIGIFFIPAVFAWFTLRKGHSTLSRILSFGWFAVSFTLSMSTSMSILYEAQKSSGSMEDFYYTGTNNEVPE